MGARCKNHNGLTALEQEFCDRYLQDENRIAYKAYMQAYPKCRSERAARVNAGRVLERPHVAAYLKERAEKATKKAELNEVRVLKEIAGIALFNPLALFTPDGHLKTIDQWPPEAMAAVKSIDVQTVNIGGKEDDSSLTVRRIQFWDKNKALDQLGKYFKLFDRAGEADMAEVFRQLSQALRPSVGPPALRDDDSSKPRIAKH